MTLKNIIDDFMSKKGSSPAQRAVSSGAPDAAENPTEGQKRVGNYRKVHLYLDGFRISIENPKGSVRSGTAPDGTKWSNTLACDYGDIRGTESVDGDPVDIYLSDHPEKGAVFVIDQIDPKTKKFDEHKVMYGFDSIEDAKKTYLACYQKGWGGLGWITPVTKAEFRKWIDSSTRKTKPFHEYASVTPIVDPIKVKAAEEKTAQVKQDDPMEGVPAGVKLRSFIDAPATRTAIMDNMLEAVKNRFPIEDDNYRLELSDVKYEGPQSYTLSQQKQALLSNRRLGCSIAGTWRLIDKATGNVLDERRDGVMRVPYYTDRGTIINNGNEYTVISQARLSPGVYTRRKQNGELESQFNVANGKGFRIGLDKSTGVMNMSIGQGHVPLYPVLKAIGVTDDDMKKAWGAEITAINMGKYDARAIEKVYDRLAGRAANPSATQGEKVEFIKKALEESGLDPDVVVRTLGLNNVTGVTKDVLLRASQKLLNVNRGAEDPDDRDNPRFSRYYGIEDMMRERVDKDAGRLAKTLLFKARRDGSLARIPRNALGPYVDTFLSGSGLAMPGEEANPLSILVQQSRITRLGEGGISSPDLVTPEARNVQGDYLGYVDFISGPESFGIGIDVRAALGTMKGSDHRLYNKMLDLHSGKTRYVALDDAASHTVAFPGQDPKSPYLYAMRKGVPTKVPRDEVDFMVPGFGNTVSAGINMTPMPTGVQTGRQFYMSKFWEQYLPQKEGEVPLVDSLMDDGKTTYSEYYGRKVGCLTTPMSGTVTKVTDDEIVVTGKDGQKHTVDLVKNLPFNRMSSITYFSNVKKGDTVNEGDILAHSNYTDAKTGALNMGRNLKVAVMTAPKGVSSFEDAIVISESAAKKLATSRLYNFERDTKDGVQVAKNKYLAAFPNQYNKDQANTIDDNGVVKVGTVLHRDDPMILAIGPKMLSAEDAQLGKLSSVLRNALTDKSQKWEHDWPGVVTDVVSGPHGAKVLVKSEPPVKVGDKLSPEFGLKGVVGGVIEDDKMPRDASTNERYDMLMNPMGFLSRVAPGQIMIMNLAKVAKKTGKQIRIPQLPPPEGWAKWVEKQMADNGVKETADVFDPQTGKTIRGVGDGYVYTKAFHHLAEKKFSARGVEGAYTQDEQPAKGGDDGAKRVSGFDNMALLSHGATDVMRDAITIRGQMNDEYWRKFRLGLPVEEPGVPFIYNKFLNTLRAGGVNVVEQGDVTSLMPQTDKDIDALAGGRVLENSQMVDSDFQPVQGGMFDLSKTGGMGGNRWSMIMLPEPVPNPMMEEPVRRVLGLTSKKMEAILSGREELNGKTGGEAIKDALSKINIDDSIERARADIKNRRGSQRDNAVKVLGYLKAAREMGMNPSDWMITRVPVIPPMFRPVAKAGDVALVPDMNELYKELIETKSTYELLKPELPASALAEERMDVYRAVKAAYGLGEPVTAEGQAKNLKGAIRQVIGTIPKLGQFQYKVLSKTQDLVGRSVTIPDKNLNMDQIGLPEEMAWTMYKPFVERKLVQRGYSPVVSREMIDEKNPTARHILEDVMEERPVLMDRAPTWHKFNIMAFKPHIVEGRSIHVSPLIDSGFNMDHDGDTVNIHVPASMKAVRQALDKMLPSKNLFSLTDMKSVRYKPEKEQISGLWALTRGRTKKPVKVFSSKEEAIKAYRSGIIGPNDPIEIA
jgi:DNA-directed RNA polymerase beta subunit